MLSRLRDVPILAHLAARDPDRAAYLTTRIAQRHAATENYQAVVGEFEAVCQGIRFARLPDLFGIGFEQDRGSGLFDRHVDGTQPCTVHPREPFQMTCRVEHCNARSHAEFSGAESRGLNHAIGPHSFAGRRGFRRWGMLDSMFERARSLSVRGA